MREPRKFFSKQSTDFPKRSPGTLCQRADRPLVPCGPLAILEMRDHEGLSTIYRNRSDRIALVPQILRERPEPIMPVQHAVGRRITEQPSSG